MRFMENEEPHVTKKKKAMLSVSTPTPTQSSTSSASSTRPQIKKKTADDGRASTPPCAQPRAHENADGDDNAASQKSDVPIVLSDSDEEEDWVEVIDDEEELGACGILLQRSAN